jgi:hypothetical protein
MAAKSITTIRQVLSYQPHQAAWFAATQALFNAVVAFYFAVIQAHEGVLALPNQEALTALEKLTHATKKNPAPVMPLSTIVGDAPALFRRAAINAALGSARSFASSLSRWRTRRVKAQAKARGKRKAKPFRERPPVPPRCWNKSVTFYAGQWKERTDASILRHRSGPAPAGVGSKSAPRDEHSPLGSRWEALRSSVMATSGGCTPAWRRSSRVQPQSQSKSRPMQRHGSARSISTSANNSRFAPFKRLKVRSLPPASSGEAKR